MPHWVYIIHSEKFGRFYTGETSDFDIRMVFHDTSDSKKFTGKARDWRLFLKFECDSKAQAMSIERHIKRMKSSVYITNLKEYLEMITKPIQSKWALL